MPFLSRTSSFAGAAPTAGALAAVHAPSPAAGILRIEPDQVDAAINVFENAVEKLKSQLLWAEERIRADPMAQDAVSQPAAEAFNRASLGGSGAAVPAWTGAVKELESIILQLKASKEAIVQADDVASHSFSSAAGSVG